MLLTGVDEAGYGPLLGPLVIGGAAFRAPWDEASHEADPKQLRAALRKAMATPGEKARGRLVVGDSKEVYGPTHDPRRLELPVLAFLAAQHGACGAPADLDALLSAVHVDPDVRGLEPWYGPPEVRLPRWADADEVARCAGALREAFAKSGVSFAGFAAQVVPETRLNGYFERDNKSDVLFARSADVLDRLVAMRVEQESIRAVMDRQGGRRFYLGPLMQRWPQRFAWAIDETPQCSRYRQRLGDAEADLRFEVEADRNEPQVGLASLLAKYLRELFMDLWNAWFQERCPGSSRTAGYSQHARQWLDETRVARLLVGLPDARLVRIR